MKDVNMCLKVRTRNLNEMLNENDTTNGKRTQKQTTEVRTTGRNNVYIQSIRQLKGIRIH